MKLRSVYGLALSGGGARAAYQVGVLRGIAEILGPDANPFDIYTGESAGAINASFLAARSNFFQGTQDLWKAWEKIKLGDVFYTSPVRIFANVMRWMKDVSTAGFLGQSQATQLLDAAPLRVFLEKNIDFAAIKNRIDVGVLSGLAISATNYATGSAITFFDSHGREKPWARSQRISRETVITLDHVMASTAIPIIFPPVKIGQSFYGDGSVRLKTPLSPAIHLGADKILAIGARFYRAPDETLLANETQKMKSITLADVAGVLLNAGFLDNLDADIERALRINETIKLVSPSKKSNLRQLSLLAIRPSCDLGALAAEEFEHFTYTLRYLMRGLGTSHNSGWDLMSYLAFDAAYTRKLLQLGYKDAKTRKSEVLDFFPLSV